MNFKILVLAFVGVVSWPFTARANYWDSRGAEEAVPKPIPGFSAQDYPSLNGMTVAETRDLLSVHPDRGLILWVKNATIHEMKDGDYGPCPSDVDGSNYSGQIFVSLVDFQKHQVIQTLYFDMSDQESSSVPFRIIDNGLYSVHGKANAIGEKETVLLAPLQIDKDPKAEEFALFVDPGGCFCPGVVAYGYDSVKDQLFRFKEVDYDRGNNGTSTRQAYDFLTDLFFVANRNPGKKTYEFATEEGHGSEVFTLHKYEYDPKIREFYGISVDVEDTDANEKLYLGASPMRLTDKALEFLRKDWEQTAPKPDAASD